MILHTGSLPEPLIEVANFEYKLMALGDYITINSQENIDVMVKLAIELAEKQNVILYNMGKDNVCLVCMKNLNQTSIPDIDRLRDFVLSKNNMVKRMELSKRFGASKVREFIRDGIISERPFKIDSKKQGRPSKFYGLTNYDYSKDDNQKLPYNVVPVINPVKEETIDDVLEDYYNNPEPIEHVETAHGLKPMPVVCSPDFVYDPDISDMDYAKLSMDDKVAWRLANEENDSLEYDEEFEGYDFHENNQE